MTDHFVLFESGAINSEGLKYVNDWFMGLHPANPGGPITEYDLVNKLIRNIYEEDMIQNLADNFTDSYVGDAYYTSVKDDIDCKREILMETCLDPLYVTSLAYRFPSNSYIFDFVVDYLARVYELSGYDEHGGYDKYFDLSRAIIICYDKFAPVGDTRILQKLVEYLNDRGVTFDGNHHRALIHLYMSNNENETYGRHIMSRAVTEPLFKIAEDEGIEMDYYERDMMKRAYMVLNMSQEPWGLNELQELIVKVFLFIYGEGYDLGDANAANEEFKEELKDAYLNCAPESYISKLDAHIDNDDWQAILDDLAQICRKYMLENDHYIVLDENYPEGTVDYRAAYEANELIMMSTEDQQDVLEGVRDDIESLIRQIVKPFDFDI